MNKRLKTLLRAALIGLATMILVNVYAGENGSGDNRGASDGGRGEAMGEPVNGMSVESVSPRLLRELDLTADQQKKLKEYRLTMEKRKIQLQSEKAITELDLKNVMSTYPVNQADAMKMGEKVADAQRKLFLLKVEAWSHFLSGLTAEQHRKVLDFQSEFQEKRRAMREEMRKEDKAWRKDGRGNGN